MQCAEFLPHMSSLFLSHSPCALGNPSIRSIVNIFINIQFLDVICRVWLAPHKRACLPLLHSVAVKWASLSVMPLLLSTLLTCFRHHWKFPSLGFLWALLLLWVDCEVFQGIKEFLSHNQCSQGMCLSKHHHPQSSSALMSKKQLHASPSPVGWLLITTHAWGTQPTHQWWPHGVNIPSWC